MTKEKFETIMGFFQSPEIKEKWAKETEEMEAKYQQWANEQFLLINNGKPVTMTPEDFDIFCEFIGEDLLDPQWWMDANHVEKDEIHYFNQEI